MKIIKKGSLLKKLLHRKPNFPMACTKCGTFFEVEPGDKEKFRTEWSDVGPPITYCIVPCPECSDEQKIDRDRLD